MSQWPPMQQQQGVGEPVPAQPLGYSNIHYGRAPGLITTIGVMSIIVASLGILVNGITGLWSLAAMTMMGAMSTRTPVAVTANSSPTVVVSPYEIEPAKRQIVIAALSKLQPLSSIRQKHLEALLKEEGKQFLTIPEESITPEKVAQIVARSGEQEGETWYVLGGGRIMVSDREARFEPLDKSSEILTASAPGSNDELAKAAVARIEALLGKKLTPAQVKALTNKLADPNQTLLSTNKKTSVTEINGAYAQSNGSVMLWMPNESVTISATGNVTTSKFNMGGPATVPPAAKRAAVMGVIDTMASLILAIYLLVAGIMTLRQSPHGGRLHWGYVGLKIPLVLASVAYWTWQVQGLPSMAPVTALSIAAAVVISLGMIYPLALIFALSARTVRGYYSTSSTV